MHRLVPFAQGAANGNDGLSPFPVRSGYAGQSFAHDRLGVNFSLACDDLSGGFKMFRILEGLQDQFNAGAQVDPGDEA